MSTSESGGDLIHRDELIVDVGDQALELIADVVPLLDPTIGHIAKLCAASIREHRCEVEKRLATRLEELTKVFSSFEIAQAREVKERDQQFRALSILLDVAQNLGEPGLVSQAMECFKEYVRTTPTFTQNVTSLAKAIKAEGS